MVAAFQVSCNDMIDQWEKLASTTGSYEIEILSSVHNMSADAISRAAFGSSFEEGRKVFELLREHLAIIVQVLQSVYIPGWRLSMLNIWESKWVDGEVPSNITSFGFPPPPSLRDLKVMDVILPSAKWNTDLIYELFIY
ncbi:hypothetical protein KSS87_005569 [Heliosperma pusillum]|nr:hypothetical protein KSS87_005569 [Heliosperma pusillum]